MEELSAGIEDLSALSTFSLEELCISAELILLEHLLLTLEEALEEALEEPPLLSWNLTEVPQVSLEETALLEELLDLLELLPEKAPLLPNILTAVA